MNIQSQIALSNLQALFGENAVITEVDVMDEFVHFNLNASVEFECQTGVDVTINSLIEGELRCMMEVDKLTEQMRIRGFLQIVFEKFKEMRDAKSTTSPTPERGV